jgi:hypothetical protein
MADDGSSSSSYAIVYCAMRRQLGSFKLAVAHRNRLTTSQRPHLAIRARLLGKAVALFGVSKLRDM